MKDFFKRKILINVGVALGIILVLGAANFVIGADVGRRAAAIQKLREELAFRNQAVESLVTLKVESERAQKYLPVLRSILPSSDGLINFSREMKSLAAAKKVDLGFAFRGESAPAGNLAATDFRMSASAASFVNILDFIKAVEGSAYFINIASMDFSLSAKSVKAELGGRVFSKP